MSDKYAVPNKLPGKTVSVLTHRKRRIHHDKAIVEQKRKTAIQRHANIKKHHNFKRAESFVMGYIKAERTARRLKHTIFTKNLTGKSTDPKTSDKLLLVLRHAGKKIFDQTTNNVLNSLNLRRRHNAVFLKNSKENKVLLQLIEPFVVFGFPNLATVRELLFKKGFASVNGKKTAIQSNTMIEEQLGENGIICLEDIIHEISTVGTNFDSVNSFLCPFMLSAPRDGWKNKVSVSFSRGGEYGDRGAGINELIPRCI